MYPSEKYDADRRQLQDELDQLRRTQAPGRKGQEKKIKDKLKHFQAKAGDPGENHNQKAKGGSLPGFHELVEED
jgi:hypothetical protein